MNAKLASLLIGFMLLTEVNIVSAATAVDLSDQPELLFSLMQKRRTLTGGLADSAVKEISRNTDFNQTTHIRVVQTYAGYPVWGGDAVIHQPKNNSFALNKVSMNGVFYRDLPLDLQQSPAIIFTPEQAEQAERAALALYNATAKAAFTTSNMTTQLMVYVDDQSIAHWAFQVIFRANYPHAMPAKPAYILDAVTLQPFENWNDLQTAKVEVDGGGIGGNPTMGKVTYDGAAGHLSKLRFERDDVSHICYLRNALSIVVDARSNNIPSFVCDAPDAGHKNVFWNTLNDEANGGYSPNNDALYSDSIVRKMYKRWFGINMLEMKGKPMQVTFKVHDEALKQNAFYDNGEMAFGEGDDESYPVVAPSVVAHEMSHGFTEQHSGLVYSNQSGGLNESFSDMADKAVEYFVYGKNNWELDPELLKQGGRVLRYMDDPVKDCDGRTPGNECSIAHTSDYYPKLNVHYSSGIYNKVFTILAGKWNTKKAFEVMVQANMNYWTRKATFSSAACGVIKATRDYQYHVDDVRAAMKVVGVNTKKCK